MTPFCKFTFIIQGAANSRLKKSNIYHGTKSSNGKEFPHSPRCVAEFKYSAISQNFPLYAVGGMGKLQHTKALPGSA